MSQDQPVAAHHLRPTQLTARRDAMPVAWLPLGILEWHGRHNPYGLDGVKAQSVCDELARRIGGVSFPALYWADHRAAVCELECDEAVNGQWLPKGTGDHCTPIGEALGPGRAAFAAAAAASDRLGGWATWRDVLVRMLHQVQALGFRQAVFYPGHYPMFPQCWQVQDRWLAEGGTMAVRTLIDLEANGDGLEGDHGARFETSLLLALTPSLVDLSAIASEGERPLGVIGQHPRTASAADGLTILSRLETAARAWLRDPVGSPGPRW